MSTFLKWFLGIVIGILGLILIIFLISWFSFNSWRSEAVLALPGNSKIAETSKGPMEYIIEGSSQNYILLLHGTPGSYRTFNTDPFLENEYSVLSPSRPGYFRTPLSVGKTPEEQADAIAALMDTLHIDAVVAVGYSGGGPYAALFALRYPEKCQKLVLISSITKKIEEVPSIQNMFSFDFGTWFVVKMMISQIEEEAFARKAEKYVQSDIFPTDQTNTGRENDFNNFINLPEIPYEKIKVPTLIIHGTKDEAIPYQQAEEMASRIPDVRLITMEGKEHFDVVFFGIKDVYSKIMNDIKRSK